MAWNIYAESSIAEAYLKKLKPLFPWLITKIQPAQFKTHATIDIGGAVLTFTPKPEDKLRIDVEYIGRDGRMGVLKLQDHSSFSLVIPEMIEYFAFEKANEILEKIA